MSSLFQHEARRGGKVVAILRGVATPEGGVTVEAEVFPAGKGPAESITRPFAFPSRSHATRFADEALLCLQYLDCEISE